MFLHIFPTSSTVVKGSMFSAYFMSLFSADLYYWITECDMVQLHSS